MKRIYLILTIVFITTSLFQDVKAQRRDWSGPWSIGIGLGPTAYAGDLNEHNDNRMLILPQSLSFAGSGYFAKGVGPLTFVLQMNIGRLQSRDYTKEQMFRNSFYDYGIRLRFNVNQILMGRRYSEENWHFYGQLGYGFMRYSSYLTDIPNDTLYSSVGYASVGKAGSFVMGAGIQYNVTNEASLHIGAEYHMLNMDDIDAHVRGVNNDSYLYISIGFSYAFSDMGAGRGRSRSLRWGQF